MLFVLAYRFRLPLSLLAEEALQDLSGFDMIWVISHMHLNKGWNRKVRPPRLPEERKGLFSTRSPHRPNAVALSSLRVDRVDTDKGVIYVRGLDLLDGMERKGHDTVVVHTWYSVACCGFALCVLVTIFIEPVRSTSCGRCT